MTGIVVNTQLAELLKSHGVQIQTDDEFISANLTGNIKFKARAVYHEVNNGISSRLDVMVVSEEGDRIIESFGDFGTTIEEAINRNFQNFSLSSLHPILAAFGCMDPETLRQVNAEEWVVNGRTWKAYIGNLVPKAIGADKHVIPPDQFFHSIESEIRSQLLTNRLHWFRSYYSQWDGNITEREFLMDNEAKNGDLIFSSLPVTAGVKFYSCRNFALLRQV
jgi:hypothetical protein